MSITTLILFFKQKSAYAMRISDWSSDVCSSDLLALVLPAAAHAQSADTPGIVVIGEGLPLPPGTPAYGSVTIDRDRLTSDASGRLEDVLADVAGVQQFRRSDRRAANPTAQGVTPRALGDRKSTRLNSSH